jgi:hypothetical protein
MNRFAAILVVAAAFTGVVPAVASAAPLDPCASQSWPLVLLHVPYC